MDEVLTRLADEDILVPFGIMSTIVLVVFFNIFGGVLKTSARERTRREIAAYIAEGSMTPEQGERLIRAGKKAGDA